MQSELQLVVFALDDQFYALYLTAVVRVIPAVEITALPKAPDIIIGVINVQGQIIPVVDVRKRFKLPKQELTDTDQFIIANTHDRAVVIIADKVNGTIEYSTQDQVQAEKIAPGLDYIDGVVKLEDGMVLIHDLDKFLSLDEIHSLDLALNNVASKTGGKHVAS